MSLRTGAVLTELIGNTPVVKLDAVVPEAGADVFVKLEWFNPTGSYKDRMALAIIEEAERRGDLRPGMTVVEYTGGSTGSSLAFVCAVKGYRFAGRLLRRLCTREAEDDEGTRGRADHRAERRRDDHPRPRAPDDGEGS